MTRKLPWIHSDSSRGRSSPRSATSSRSKRSRPILDSSDVELPSGREKRKGMAPTASAREASTSPPIGPPEESFMIDGFGNDDRYRMVEDELLDMAKEFTQHLHAAEYLRMKNAAKAQNAAAVNSISRPVTSKMDDQTKRKVESIARARKQSEAIKGMRGDQPQEPGGDSDESQGPWLGTALHGLMERSRASALPLTDISGFRSTSKAAAGYKGSLVGRMETYDMPKLESPELVKSTSTIKSAFSTGDTETEDDDDDLAAAPVGNYTSSSIKEEPIEQKGRMHSESDEAKPLGRLKCEGVEPSNNLEESTSGEDRISAESKARIDRRREQAKTKRIKGEDDKKELKSIPQFL